MPLLGRPAEQAQGPEHKGLSPALPLLLGGRLTNGSIDLLERGSQLQHTTSTHSQVLFFILPSVV